MSLPLSTAHKSPPPTKLFSIHSRERENKKIQMDRHCENRARNSSLTCERYSSSFCSVCHPASHKRIYFLQRYQKRKRKRKKTRENVHLSWQKTHRGFFIIIIIFSCFVPNKTIQKEKKKTGRGSKSSPKMNWSFEAISSLSWFQGKEKRPIPIQLPLNLAWKWRNKKMKPKWVPERPS